MSKVISIVIPCHNAGRWIAFAIESALNQKYLKNPEVIVIENGSTDNTAEIAQRYLPRIDFIQTESALTNGNIARNIGLRRATGTWIQFLDGDDYLEPQKVATNLRVAIASDNCDAVYSPIIEETSFNDKAVNRHVISYDESEDDYLRWIRWKLCQTGGVLWKRDALETIGGWNEAMPHCQDNEICLRALKAGLHFVFDPNPGAVYRIHGQTTVSRRSPNAVSHTKSRLQIEMLDWLDAEGLATDEHRLALGQALFENARMVARSDIETATRLLRTNRKNYSVSPSGPAAPRTYRLTYWLFGFANAERIARLFRPKKRTETRA